MDKVLIVCGPTATGKTKLALEIAMLYGGELVSADSRQIYRGMDIGTGKDLPSEKNFGPEIIVQYHDQKYPIKSYLVNQIPLWMYDVVNPDEDFSVSHFHQLASQVIKNIITRGKLPIVVGGTGFYLKSLLNPPETISVPQNLDLRNKLQSMSVTDLGIMLQKQNPKFWDQMNNSDRHNPRRLVRRLEIENYLQNSTLTNINVIHKYNFFTAYLTADSKYLNERIDERVTDRVEKGILPEIQGLLDQGYNWQLNSMCSLGYIEWKPWFLIKSSDKNHHIYNICLSKWITDEHAYAKRQMTWFKKQPNLQIYDISDGHSLETVKQDVSKWYTYK